MIMERIGEREGEVYRIERSAFDRGPECVQRYFRMCSGCRGDVEDCECKGGPLEADPRKHI